MPKSAHEGQWTVGLDGKRVATLMGPLAEIVDAFLEQHKSAPTYRSRWRSVFDSLPSALSSGAHVSGSVPVDKEVSPASLFASSLGWRVGVVDTRADKLFKLFTDLEGIVADRETQKLIKDLLPNEKVPLPKVRHKVVKVNGFPARATAFVMEFPAAMFDKLAEKQGVAKGKKPLFANLVFVPDGERTWFSLAADEKVAISSLESARASGGTLREVPELQPLKQKPAITSGFFTLEGLFASLAGVAKAAKFDIENALTHAPNHGRTPWLTRFEHTPKGSGLRVRANVRVPRQAFADIGGVAPSVVQAFNR
ncbi:MAG: hypothetical protein QM756_18850 [Polyangiaceae bacterium]